MDNVSVLRLDLLALSVDAVLLDGAPVAWMQNSAGVQITAGAPFSTSTPQILTIQYHGVPPTDASGWGGFYNQSGYTYNLGVGFAADPHSYGRAWHPCFDNFVERSTYTVVINSVAGKPGYGCGALALDSVGNDGSLYRGWTLNESIPSYLACFAIGPYVSFKRVYPGELQPIPVEIACPAADTTKLKNSFIHLPECIAAYEYWFGPYRWEKVGYSIVPFNSGAMEHATNIAYMRAAVDGSTANETLMAHELSHHWWGDLVTCSTAEDMWLNEGWASYSAQLFLEKVYGKKRFLDEVTANHLQVLENTHRNEGGYRAVSGLPHDLTYGSHVYDKGAVVAHNLRGYLGDSLFRLGCRTLMANNAFSDWSSAEVRDHLTAATGTNMTSFFDNWVFSPGYADYSVDSFQVVNTAGQLHVRVYVKQKLRGAPAFHENVPLEFTLVPLDQSAVPITYRAWVSGETSIVDLPFDYVPKSVWINESRALNLAQLVNNRIIAAAGSTNLPQVKMLLNATVADSNLIQIQYHFSMPDTGGISNPHQFKLTNRWWRVDGYWDGGLALKADINYDGRGTYDYLDTELFAQTGNKEDSIILLYRLGAGHPWEIAADYIKNILGPNTDKYGKITINNLQPGDYTIAKGSATTSTNDIGEDKSPLNIIPNPADDRVEVVAPFELKALQLFDAKGRLVLETDENLRKNATIALKNLPQGMYWITAIGVQGEMRTAQIMVKHGE